MNPRPYIEAKGDLHGRRFRASLIRMCTGDAMQCACCGDVRPALVEFSDRATRLCEDCVAEMYRAFNGPPA